MKTKFGIYEYNGANVDNSVCILCRHYLIGIWTLPTPDLKELINKAKRCKIEFTRHFHIYLYAKHKW